MIYVCASSIHCRLYQNERPSYLGVELARGVQIVIVGCQTSIFQGLGLLFIQHSQGTAYLHAHRATAAIVTTRVDALGGSSILPNDLDMV